MPRWTAGAVVTIALLALASCGVPTQGRTEAIADDRVPYGLLDAAPTTTSTTVPAQGSTTLAQEFVQLYFVRNDRIERRYRSVAAAAGLAERLRLLAEPLPAVDTEAGFRSAVAPGSFTSATPTVRGGVATVDLSAEFTSVPAREQVLAFAQITYTLTDLPGIGQVSFTLNGSPIQALDPEGVAMMTSTVNEDTYLGLLASSPPS